MIMPWFIPIGILLGVTCTRTALHARRMLMANHQENTWWLLAVLAWLPMLCWLLAQFVDQG